ncbi:PTS sugar transporter subunit IIC [Fusobacterium sp.]|uniref:PTS sugar transporter subunit IIC n=1 Tax=unclassified Fusobacterium TaxID=2648384 RepID=UPI0025BC54F9|nr:PTS sugar transporter subunit IIC [Fusobacterium sp.]
MKNNNLVEKVTYFAGKVGGQRHLLGLRDGMAAAMPLVIIGSFFMLLAQFPFEPFTKWLQKVGLQAFFNKASDSTFGIIGLVISFSVAYHLGSYYKINKFSAGVLSLASFIILTPIYTIDIGAGFPIKYMGSAGMFAGIIIALITTEIYRWFEQNNIMIKMPDSVPPSVSRAFSAIIPGLAIVSFWVIISIILTYLGVENIHSLIQSVLGSTLGLLSNTLPGIILVIFIQCFFWMFGIHGAQVTGPLIEPLLLQASDINRTAYIAGQELPNIITYEFVYNFVFTGGAGCLFAMALLLFFKSKSKENKILGKIALPPTCFQVPESILFGFPIIMNFKIAIPFVLAPITTTIVTYYAMYFGLVAKPIGAIIPWTTPPVIAGFLATGGHISGAIIQIITIAINILIYLPFFLKDDKMKIETEKKAELEKSENDFENVDLNNFTF